jgi:hypothetical protein
VLADKHAEIYFLYSSQNGIQLRGLPIHLLIVGDY